MGKKKIRIKSHNEGCRRQHKNNYCATLFILFSSSKQKKTIIHFSTIYYIIYYISLRAI